MWSPRLRQVSAGCSGCRTGTAAYPTFCRGWGTLPFDRSTPEITAHALQAWSVWCPHLDLMLKRDVPRRGGASYEVPRGHPEADGAWIPLWFGNELAPGEDNPAYGTARVLLGLCSATRSRRSRNHELSPSRRPVAPRGAEYGRRVGRQRAVPSSIEETGIVMAALGRSSPMETRAKSRRPSRAAQLAA